jgi:hypothetical protein
MIKVIRIRWINEELPAGSIFIFDSGSDAYDCSCVANFFWGKELANYLVIKNGHEINLLVAECKAIETALINCQR